MSCIWRVAITDESPVGRNVFLVLWRTFQILSESEARLSWKELRLGITLLPFSLGWRLFLLEPVHTLLQKVLLDFQLHVAFLYTFWQPAEVTICDRLIFLPITLKREDSTYGVDRFIG